MTATEARRCPHLGVPLRDRNGIDCHPDGSTCWGDPGRLVSIMPAAGWSARYRTEEEGEFDCPLAAWGLFESCYGDRVMIGIDPTRAYERIEDEHAYVCIATGERWRARVSV
jgi:hypothetical protein